MNYQKLKGRIVEICGSQRAFADKIGVTEQTITNKITGKSQFDLNDVITWCKALEIAREDIADYFFANQLTND